jgi:hypothetical protein
MPLATHPPLLLVCCASATAAHLLTFVWPSRGHALQGLKPVQHFLGTSVKGRQLHRTLKLLGIQTDPNVTLAGLGKQGQVCDEPWREGAGQLVV